MGVGVSGGRKSIKKCVSVGDGVFFPHHISPSPTWRPPLADSIPAVVNDALVGTWTF